MKPLKHAIKLALLFILMSQGKPAWCQQQEAALFLDDNRYTKGLEYKVMQAHKQQNGKAKPALQRVAANIKEDMPAKINLPSEANKTILLPEQLYENRKKAVLMMGRLSNDHRGPRAQLYATGFILTEDGVCVTNRHVLAELIDPVSPADSLASAKQQSIYFVQTYDGKVYLLDQILAYSTINDVAIFRIKSGDQKHPYIPLGNALAPASPVHIIAHPNNNYFYYSQGVVARNNRLSFPGSQQERWQMNVSADYAVGSSGGPIMDQYGSVSGIVSSTLQIHPPNQYIQMVLKNAISVLAIKNLLN